MPLRLQTMTALDLQWQLNSFGKICVIRKALNFHGKEFTLWIFMVKACQPLTLGTYAVCLES